MVKSAVGRLYSSVRQLYIHYLGFKKTIIDYRFLRAINKLSDQSYLLIEMLCHVDLRSDLLIGFCFGCRGVGDEVFGGT